MNDILSFLKEEFNEQRVAFTFSRKKVSEIIRALEELDAINDEYIRTISEQNKIIRDLQIERHAFTAQCADEIRKIESKSDVWMNLAHDREIGIGEKINLLKELVEVYDINNPSDMYVLIKKIREL